MRTMLWTIAVAVAMVAGTVLWARTSDEASGAVVYGRGHSWARAGPAVVATAPFAGPARSFTIAGTVSGLYPGEMLPLTLTVSNRLAASITVTSITTSVATASKACSAANVAVSAFSGHLRLGARKSGTVTVDVTMARAASNVCQGARFPFTYSGKAKVLAP
jgi:hypothetical protein